MSKVALFVTAWVVAAAVALGVAWQGVGIVGQQVTQSRPAPLTAREIQQRVNAPTGAAPADTTTTTTAPPGGPSTTVTTAAASTRSTTQPTVRPQASTTTTIPRTTTTTRPPAPAVTRTYSVTGGSASLRFTESGVTVLWANPNAGYDVHVENENGNGVRVEFDNSSHRSRIDGWWDGGPQDRVREDSR